MQSHIWATGSVFAESRMQKRMQTYAESLCTLYDFLEYFNLLPNFYDVIKYVETTEFMFNLGALFLSCSGHALITKHSTELVCIYLKQQAPN